MSAPLPFEFGFVCLSARFLCSAQSDCVCFVVSRTCLPASLPDSLVGSLCVPGGMFACFSRVSVTNAKFHCHTFSLPVCPHACPVCLLAGLFVDLFFRSVNLSRCLSAPPSLRFRLPVSAYPFALSVVSPPMSPFVSLLGAPPSSPSRCSMVSFRFPLHPLPIFGCPSIHFTFQSCYLSAWLSVLIAG